MPNLKPVLSEIYHSRLGRFAARSLNWLYIKFLGPLPTRIGNTVLYAHTFDRFAALQLLKRHTLEDAETRLCSLHIKPGWIVVDVGANIGYYTVLAGKLAGDAGRVIAFEPDAANAKMLDRNIHTNGLSNVTLVEKGVSDRTGMATLYLSDAHSGDHRIYNPDNRHKSHSIEIITLDDYFKPGQRIDFIKMDIQGSEMAAFRGMKRVLTDNPSCKMLCEFSPQDLSEGGTDPRNFLAMLGEFSFTVSLIDDKTGNLVSTASDLLIRQANDNGYVNLFLTRS